MASSKLMTSSSPANQDLQKQQQLLHISDHKNNENLISMNMDDILKTIYDQPPTDGDVTNDPEMTLEDFLDKSWSCLGRRFGGKLPPRKRKVGVDDVVVDKEPRSRSRGKMIKNRAIRC
ncbi:hypothetical protein Tco_1506257 [Tanacetum coccineum]